jgi:hypothetical protein
MITGDSTNWEDLFQVQLVPFILELVLSTWEKMPKPEPSDVEDCISNQLYCALRQSKRRNSIPLHISREDRLFDLDTANETGRMDIVFYPPTADQDIYLCIEAKRLNAEISGENCSLASEYVKEGMQRFVDGKYSRSVRHGAMLGYVLDGDVERATRNIQNNIVKRLTELRLSNKTGLLVSSIRPADAWTKETHHQREFEDAIFRIHHLFVSG